MIFSVSFKTFSRAVNVHVHVVSIRLVKRGKRHALVETNHERVHAHVFYEDNFPYTSEFFLFEGSLLVNTTLNESTLSEHNSTTRCPVATIKERKPREHVQMYTYVQYMYLIAMMVNFRGTHKHCAAGHLTSRRTRRRAPLPPV